jgi:hypothetical protein
MIELIATLTVVGIGTFILIKLTLTLLEMFWHLFEIFFNVKP